MRFKQVLAILGLLPTFVLLNVACTKVEPPNPILVDGIWASPPELGATWTLPEAWFFKRQSDLALFQKAAGTGDDKFISVLEKDGIARHLHNAHVRVIATVVPVKDSTEMAVRIELLDSENKPLNEEPLYTSLAYFGEPEARKE